MDIIERMKAGELILETDPDYPSLHAEFEKTMDFGTGNKGNQNRRRI